MDIQIIRKAICKNRGGLESADDNQILSIWNSLDVQTQEFYLQSLNSIERIIDATRHKSKGVV